jgi:hypothetical protein
MIWEAWWRGRSDVGEGGEGRGGGWKGERRGECCAGRGSLSLSLSLSLSRTLTLQSPPRAIIHVAYAVLCVTFTVQYLQI